MRQYIAGMDLKKGDFVEIGRDRRLYRVQPSFHLSNGETLYVLSGDFEVRNQEGEVVEKGYA